MGKENGTREVQKHIGDQNKEGVNRRQTESK